MTAEFSHLIAIEGIIPDRERVEILVANEESCTALAKRLDLRALSNLTAKVIIRRMTGGAALSVSGTFEADVVQSCVITLRDVPAHVAGSFQTFFAEPGRAHREIDFTPEDDEESAEIIENGMIDLGEVVAQYLSLELEPYPRAPGVSLPAQMAGSGVVEKQNPFSVLADMKDKILGKKSEK